MPPTSVADKQRINSLTARQLQSSSEEGDWSAILEMCDHIRRGRGEDFLDTIKEPLKRGAPSMQLRALNMLDACVSNSGPEFALMLATEEWMERMIKVAKASTAVVRDKIMLVVVEWSQGYNAPGFRRAISRMANSKTLGPPFHNMINEVRQSRQRQQAAASAGGSSQGASRRTGSPVPAESPTTTAVSFTSSGAGQVGDVQPSAPPERHAAGLSNAEVLILNIQGDLANFQLGLQRPEMFEDGMVEEMKQHQKKILSMLATDLARATAQSLLNLNDEIQEVMELYEALHGAETAGDEAGDESSSDNSETPKEMTSGSVDGAGSAAPPAEGAAHVDPNAESVTKQESGVLELQSSTVSIGGTKHHKGGHKKHLKLPQQPQMLDTGNTALLDAEKQETKRLKEELEKTRVSLEELQNKYQEAKRKNKKAVELVKELEAEKDALADAAAAANSQVKKEVAPPPPPQTIVKKPVVDKAVLNRYRKNLQEGRRTLRGLKDQMFDLKKNTEATLAQIGQCVGSLKGAVEHDRKADQKAMKWLEDLYKKEQKLRKQYYNTIQELKGNIRVYCRVRPISKTEMDDGHANVVTFPVDDELVLKDDRGKLKSFEFDAVFKPESTQEQVFEDTAPLIDSVVDGFNVCIFAYGQTGTGKTHTMNGYGDQVGINKRALNRLFEIIGERKESETSTVHVSVLEIYNDAIRDLLVSREEVKKNKYEVKAGGPTGQYVTDLSDEEVFSAADIEHVMERATQNRSESCTNMNEHSSRSHMLLYIIVRTTNNQTGIKTYGKLSLVDLAGSERLDKSGSEGKAKTEAVYINKSLSALGGVIGSLSSGAKHVPYRDSTLTHLLQDSMAGQAKVLMFVCISPASYNSQESNSSLLFASRARGVALGQVKKNITN